MLYCKCVDFESVLTRIFKSESCNIPFALNLTSGFEYDKEIEVPDIYIYVNGQKYNLKYLNKTIEVKRNTDVIEDFRYKHSGNYGHIGYTVVCENEIGYRGNRFYKEGEFEINLYFVIHLDGVDYHLDPFKIKFKVC